MWRGDADRRDVAGNVTYLSQRLSWCSCALLSSLRMKTRCSSCRRGTLPASFAAPGGSCWGVFLLIPSPACSCLLPERVKFWKQGDFFLILFYFFWGGQKKKLAEAPAQCLTNTQWLQRWSIRQRGKGPVLPPLRGPSVSNRCQVTPLNVCIGPQRRIRDAARNKGCLLKCWNLLQMFYIILSYQPGQTTYTGNQRLSSQSTPGYVPLHTLLIALCW